MTTIPVKSVTLQITSGSTTCKDPRGDGLRIASWAMDRGTALFDARIVAGVTRMNAMLRLRLHDVESLLDLEDGRSVLSDEEHARALEMYRKAGETR